MPKQCVAVDRWADEVVQVVLVDPENTEDRTILKVGDEGVEKGDLDHYIEEKFYDESGEEVGAPEKEGGAQSAGEAAQQTSEERLAMLQQWKADGVKLTAEEEALVSAEEQRLAALEKSPSLPQSDSATGRRSTPPVVEDAPAGQPPPDRDGGAKGEGPVVDGSHNQGGNVG